MRIRKRCVVAGVVAAVVATLLAETHVVATGSNLVFDAKSGKKSLRLPDVRIPVPGNITMRVRTFHSITNGWRRFFASEYRQTGYFGFQEMPGSQEMAAPDAALFFAHDLAGAAVNKFLTRAPVGKDASNAFVVASQIAGTIEAIPGEKVIMAHSLGNMVVSSMIQDYGLQVSKYLMCNSAVPAEAYDTTLSPTNVLVHKAWNEYPRKSFANEWYRLFEDDVGDDRRLLTWGGRFADVVNVVVNFYSTGDHVLELYPNNNVWPTDGYDNWDQMFEHYSWHKQELWKGRKDIIARVGTTDWAGWSIRENMLGYNTIQPTNAWLMSGAELKTNTVFKLQPECMNTNSIPLLVRGAILTKGIPARTPACGAMKWGSGMNMEDSMVNLNDTTANRGVPRPNGWEIRPKSLFENWGNRWLHSDMKDMAYFYVFKFFEKVKEEGELE